MISGKLRRRPGPPGAIPRTITVDGTEYTWVYRHAFDVWGKHVRSISLSVSLRPARTRELVLDLSLALEEEEGTPSEERLLRTLPDAIRDAIEAGWDPESRGRAFRYEITEAL
jgi:hypothetical protein